MSTTICRICDKPATMFYINPRDFVGNAYMARCGECMARISQINHGARIEIKYITEQEYLAAKLAEDL
jgi:hypothetical protein